MSQLKCLLLAQIGYTGWATRQLFAACSALTADELARDLGASHVSILQTFCHMYAGERVWLDRLVEGGTKPLPQEPTPEHSFDFLVGAWPELWNSYRLWLESAPDSDLIEQLSTLLPGGGDLRLLRWQMVLHAVNHATLHRGQIITMLRALGRKPPNTDVTEYYLTL